jgi:uncharacterized damage-inducible protein DinB
MDELNAPGNAGHGSIRETLLHQITAKKGWLSWWDGSMSLEESISYEVELDDYPDLAALRAFWEEVEAQTSDFLDGLSDEDTQRVFDVDLPWGVPPTTFTLWQMMLHVANHGTQHRGEVAAMLTLADRSPGDLDLLFYFLEQIRRGARSQTLPAD